MTLILLAFLSACSDDNSGEVFSKENAPWPMDSATVFLFRTSGDNNGRDGKGVLAISTDAATACKDIRNGIPAFGSGIWFELEYFTGRTVGSAAPAWDGLYVSGDATSTDSQASRSLTVSGWHEGFSYTFAGTDAWMDVNHGSRDRFAGEFSTQWWTGKFDAQNCESGGGSTSTSDEDEDSGDPGT